MNNIKIGVVISYITQFSGIVISLFYIPIMLRMLGQEEYGLYALVQSIVAYLQMSEMGIGITATRYNAKYIAIGDGNEQEGANGMFNLLYLGIATFCTLVGILVYWKIPNWYDHYSDESISLIQVLFVFAMANLVITLVFKIYNAIVIAYEKFIFLKLLMLIVTVMGPVGMLCVLYMGYRSVGMLCVTTVFSLLTGLAQLFYCKRVLRIKFRYKNFPKALFGTIFSFTAFVFLNSIAHQLFSNSDKIVISMFLAEASIAVYAIVVQFQMYFFNFSNIISVFFLPRFTKSVAKTGKVNAKLMEEIVRTARIQFFIASMIFGGFIAIGEAFIVRWVGDEYRMAYILIVFVLLVELIGSPQSMFNSLMQALNLHKGRSIISLCFAVVKIFVVIALVYKHGLMGCAIGYFIGYMLRFIAYNIYYDKKGISMKYFWSKLIPLFCKMSVLLVALFFVFREIFIGYSINSYITIAFSAFVYLILFCVVSWYIMMTDYEKDIVKRECSKLKIKK